MSNLSPLEIAEAKAATLADLLNSTLNELSIARAFLARHAREEEAEPGAVSS